MRLLILKFRQKKNFLQNSWKNSLKKFRSKAKIKKSKTKKKRTEQFQQLFRSWIAGWNSCNLIFWRDPVFSGNLKRTYSNEIFSDFFFPQPSFFFLLSVFSVCFWCFKQSSKATNPKLNVLSKVRTLKTQNLIF